VAAVPEGAAIVAAAVLVAVAVEVVVVLVVVAAEAEGNKSDWEHNFIPGNRVCYQGFLLAYHIDYSENLFTDGNNRQLKGRKRIFFHTGSGKLLYVFYSSGMSEALISLTLT